MAPEKREGGMARMNTGRRPRQRSTGYAVLVCLSVASVACATAEPSSAIAISCGGVGTQLELCRSAAEEWGARTGHRVQLVSTPVSSTERLALYQQLLAAGVSDIDVFQIDVVWPGILGPHFIDLAPFVEPGEIAQHFDAIIENNTVAGRLVALPWYADAGLLYYRRDLLEKYARPIPRTWDELTDTAQLVQDGERRAGHERLWGYVWQGRAYEGLTCNALEWVASSGGGTVVDVDGTIDVRTPAVARALTRAAQWVGRISPPGVLNYAEEEARGVFHVGDAIFMRNWPYAWGLLNADDSPVKGLVGIALLPHGAADETSAAALGGWQLAVSRYSRHKDAAVDLVRFLTSAEEQKRRALGGAFLPTIERLYQDEEVRRARPNLDVIHEALTRAVARPSRVTGVRYNQVSSAFYQAVHATLASPGDVDQQLDRLNSQLHRLSRGGLWPSAGRGGPSHE